MNRLINARLLLAIAIAISIGAVEIGNFVAPVSAEQSADAPVIESDRLQMLPTIDVRAPDEIQTLPLVLVRPTPAQLAVPPATAAVASTSTSSSPPSVGATLPHVRLDMPYYSFGKMLPNVIKD